MKKILILLIAVTFTGCVDNSVKVTFDDDKSNAIRAHYQNYLNNDTDGLKELWSEDLNIYLNETSASGVDDIVAVIKAQHASFDNISMSFGDEELEMDNWIQTIDFPAIGENNPAITITQTWFTWSGTGKTSGLSVEVPVHISFGWGEDGKIVQEWHNFDPAKIVAEIELTASQSSE
jgi:hypothetical protein